MIQGRSGVCKLTYLHFSAPKWHQTSPVRRVIPTCPVAKAIERKAACLASQRAPVAHPRQWFEGMGRGLRCISLSLPCARLKLASQSTVAAASVNIHFLSPFPVCAHVRVCRSCSGNVRLAPGTWGCREGSPQTRGAVHGTEGTDLMSAPLTE